MKTQLIDRYGTAVLQGELPQAPHSKIADLVRRASSILHMRDRWKHRGKASLAALLAFGFLAAGVFARNELLVLCAFLGFVCAFALLFRLSPARLDTQITQTAAELEEAVSAFDRECQGAVGSFINSALNAAKQEAQDLIRTGLSLAALNDWQEEMRGLFCKTESEAASELSVRQNSVKNRREEFNTKRRYLANAGRGLRAQWFPGPARGAAREALNAAAQLAEARIDEAIAKAQVHAFRAIAENLSRGESLEIGTSAVLVSQPTPVWLGTPLPPSEVLELEASRLVENNIKSLRAKVVESGDKETLHVEIQNLFNGSLPGPKSVEEYVATLNGESGEFAERILREVTPFAPVSTIAGKPRFRKLLVMTAGATNSTVFRNLREALSDQALQIVAREHPATDVLCVEDEWCLCAGEFSEVGELIKDFRALSPEQQDLLCTACESGDLRTFFPELPEDHTQPTRLLACARVFDVIQRSGSENYTFDDAIIAKGYRAALDTITLDHALAGNIATRVEAVISSDGGAAAFAKLTSAKNDAPSFVPKEFVKLFRAGIDEALSELRRRKIAFAN